MDTTDKYCSCCKQYKPKKDFFKNVSKVDNLSNYCKECHSYYNAMSRLAHPKTTINNRNKLPETKTKYKSWGHKVFMVNDDLFKLEYECNFFNVHSKQLEVRSVEKFMDRKKVRYFFKELCIPFKVEQP